MSKTRNAFLCAGMGAAFGFGFLGGEELLNVALAAPLRPWELLEILPFYVLIPGLVGLGLGAVGFQGIAAAIWLWGGFCTLLLVGPASSLASSLGLPPLLGLVLAPATMLPLVIGLLFFTRDRDSLRWGTLASAWMVTLVVSALNQWIGRLLSPLALGVDVLALGAGMWLAPQLAKALSDRQPRAGVMAFLAGVLLWVLRFGAAATVSEKLPVVPAYKGPTQPNMVLVVVTGLRADRLGFYGYKDSNTPALDELASRSIAFDQAHAASSDSLAGMASLLTGRLPGSHKAGTPTETGRLPLSAGSRTVPEYLSSANYHTGAIFADPKLSKGLGLEQGFDWVDTPLAIGHRPLILSTLNALRVPVLRDRDHASARQMVDRALQWANAQTSSRAPWFLLLQIADLEHPYPLPRELMDSQKGSPLRYNQALTEVDQELARLFKGLSTDTWIVITADHGSNLGERGQDPNAPNAWRLLSGVNLYQEDLRVPIFVMRPRNLKPHTVTRPVSVMDLMPTILEWGELRPLEGLDGRLLGEVFGRRPPEQEDPVVSQLLGDPTQVAVRVGPWKLIEKGESRALYNLILDPTETQDLSAQEPKWLEDLSYEVPGRTRVAPPPPPEPQPALGPDGLPLPAEGAPLAPGELPPGLEVPAPQAP